MALQSSGAISLSDIAAEFGGSTPHSLSEYYGVATGVPSSGTIDFADFYGTSAYTPPTVCYVTVVGGGGGGGSGNSTGYTGNGGGAGGRIEIATVNLYGAVTLNVSVGGGGARAVVGTKSEVTWSGTNAAHTGGMVSNTAGKVTSNIGGGAGKGPTASYGNGGGGYGNANSGYMGASGYYDLYAGGDGASGAYGGGGGGYLQQGQDADSMLSYAGDGGNGASIDTGIIVGTGGGGGAVNGARGVGGSNNTNGGQGAQQQGNTLSYGSNGAANRGAGGGGGSYNSNNSWWSNGNGWAGGSGIVVIKYSSSADPAPATTGSPTVSTSGGWRYYVFNSSGTITL